MTKSINETETRRAKPDEESRFANIEKYLSVALTTSNMKKLYLALAILIVLLFVGGCSKDYTCPDISKLDHNSETGQYTQWINCEPPAKCNIDSEYEIWVNKNCDINFKIQGAY